MKKSARLIYCCAIIIFLFPTIAFAYIDPGTGSIILQGLAAAAIAVAAFWGRIKNIILSLFTKKSSPE